jgi:hypothetical protein
VEVNELRMRGVDVDVQVRNAIEGRRAFEFLELLGSAGGQGQGQVNETQTHAGVRARASSIDWHPPCSLDALHPSQLPPTARPNQRARPTPHECSTGTFCS